jgi:hypothetical protein
VEAITYVRINERERAAYYGICRSTCKLQVTAEYIFEN